MFKIQPLFQLCRSFECNEVYWERPSDFWKWLASTGFLDIHSSFKGLHIQNVGFISREWLFELWKRQLFIHPEEIPFLAKLSPERLSEAKENGWNSLHLAVKEGSLEWAEVAVKYNDLEARSAEGKTALQYAIEASSHGILHLLVVH